MLDQSRAFTAERLFLLIAANQLLQCARWADELGLLEDGIFDRLYALDNDIEKMRNLSEHAVEYFRGPGRFPKEWDSGNCDPSSTACDRIGDRLSWKALAEISAHIREALPVMYIRPAAAA